MITNKQITDEVEHLKTLFKNGETEIPSMFKCFLPGMAAMSWLVLWPLVLYGYKFVFLDLTDAARLGVAASVLFGLIAGLFTMIFIANVRAIYLSIPKSFREKSALCKFIVTKAKAYGLTYMVSYALLIVFCSFLMNGAIYSAVLFVLSSFGFMIFMNVDLNRYQLTALTSLLESIKPSTEK